MKQLSWLIIVIAISFSLKAQQQTPRPVNPTYRATAEKINDLVHTKLEVKFDYSKSYLYGKEWVTLKPHFYPTDSLTLDAKGMDIHNVSVVKAGKSLPLKYRYDSLQLFIQLDKTYKGGEQYQVFIDYTAKPNELKQTGSAAITSAKGLYFINPLGTDKNKPTQIWTQGETESNSAWFPTIDKPNQKTTEEILMTVPAKYVTLSNGKLISQKKNPDGTRTDHWKMDLPHSPYLFFMGVGDYAIIKDSYKGKEVAYYVEKEYAPVARKIFGNTPEMMGYFSKITGVEYPWNKYDQITGQDYVSGAMENTTATLHGSRAQQDARQLVDENTSENTIAHELFHQWFGDLVTAESWSQLTLNESFASIGSQLWDEYKYGKDYAYHERYTSMKGYLNGRNEQKQLVRWYYNDKEDMFDAVSYNKGAAILQMLRNYVGDSAFFKSLNLYLNNNKFKAAEAENLRLAFEEVTGEDLNWFWNQWYYSAGHPKLDVNYNYDNDKNLVQVIVKQTQTGKPFRLPVGIDVYGALGRKRYNVWVNNATDTFTFPLQAKPFLVNFDGDKVLLAEKTENKSLDDYAYQYSHALNYIDRREAIEAAAKNQDEKTALNILTDALGDKFFRLRSITVGLLDMQKSTVKNAVEPLLVKMAKSDEKRLVRAAAIGKLGELKDVKYLPLFKASLNDSSYSVAGNALSAISQLDPAFALTEAKRMVASKQKGVLLSAINRVILENGSEAEADIIFDAFEKQAFNQAKLDQMGPMVVYLNRINSLEIFKRGIDDLVKLMKDVPGGYRRMVWPAMQELMRRLQTAKQTAGQQQLAAYVESQLEQFKN